MTPQKIAGRRAHPAGMFAMPLDDKVAQRSNRKAEVRGRRGNRGQ